METKIEELIQLTAALENRLVDVRAGQDELLARNVKMSHNCGYRSHDRRISILRQMGDAGIIVGTVFAFCLGVGGIGVLLTFMVNEIRKDDLRNVKLLFDVEARKIVPAYVLGDVAHERLRRQGRAE